MPASQHHKHELSDSERAQMRGALLAFLVEHPPLVPLRIRALAAFDAAGERAAFLLASPRMRLAGALAALVIVAGAGTSYAAESALPGDPLYAVKVNINEKIAAALATTPAAHAQLDAQLAARRLQEAETLAADNKLSPQASAEIESNLNRTTTDFNANVAALATSSGSGAAQAVDVQSKLEATLAAHAHVLDVLSRAIPAATPGIVSIASAVNAHIAAARAADARIEVALTGSSTAPLEQASAATQQSAEDALSSVQALTAQAQVLGASSSKGVAAGASSVAEAVAEGKDQAQHGDWGEAIGAFQTAIRTAARMQAEVDAGIHLKKILPAVSLGPVDASPSEGLPPLASSTASTSATTSASSSSDNSAN